MCFIVIVVITTITFYNNTLTNIESCSQLGKETYEHVIIYTRKKISSFTFFTNSTNKQQQILEVIDFINIKF